MAWRPGEAFTFGHIEDKVYSFSLLCYGQLTLREKAPLISNFSFLSDGSRPFIWFPIKYQIERRIFSRADKKFV